MTVAEQMAQALQRCALDRPLSSGGLTPSELRPGGPTRLPPPAPDEIQPEPEEEEDPEWHWRDPDGEVTTHISFRLFSPHYESESLDLGMAFPLDGERVLEFVQESARVIDKPWLNVAIFSQPQLHDDYGSVILVPEWLGASEKEVLLVDASGVGHGIFAHYQSGPISRYSMLRLIEYEGPDEAEVYAFGAREPLIENEPVPPVPGGLVKIIVKGDPLHWATPIADRLQAPDMWRPDTEHCGHLEGRHLDFQTAGDQYLHQVRGGRTSPPSNLLA